MVSWAGWLKSMFYNLDFNKKRLTHEVTGVQVWTGEWICCWISPGLAVVVKLGPSITGGGCIATGQDSDIGHNSTYTHTHTPVCCLLDFFDFGFSFSVWPQWLFFWGGAGEQEEVGPTGSESDFSRGSCAKSRYWRGLHLHGEPFTWGPDQVLTHVSSVPLRLLRASSSWMQRVF